MKKKLLFISAFIVCCFNICAQDIDYKPFPQWSWNKEGATEFYLYTPSNIPAGKKCPIVVFLHGCCGENDKATPRNCVDPGARVWHNFGENTQPEPTYILAVATSRGYTQHFTSVKKTIDGLVNANKVDPQRIYINGFSMGGNGTYQFINQFPKYFAAAAPMGTVPSSTGANLSVLKNMPIFHNTANFDNSASVLTDIGNMRVANGYSKPPNTWESGVNPRLQIYNGDHGAEQFASTQDQGLIFVENKRTRIYSLEYEVYQNWMLTQINDGNQYPNVYFETPNYIASFPVYSTIPVKIKATDNDGSVVKVELYMNKILKKTLTTPVDGFYNTDITIGQYETMLEAKAFDNKGKSSTSTIYVRTDAKPIISTVELPEAKAGALYSKPIFAIGNKPFTYKLSANSDILPKGLSLSPEGIIKGIPVVTGNYNISIRATSITGDSVIKSFPLKVSNKNSNEVLVTNAQSKLGNLSLSSFKAMNGELCWIGSREANLSNLGVYNGYTLIQTKNENDTSLDYLSFTIDEPSTIYVAYEKFDNLFTSSIPNWLSKDFKKETSNEIAIQYFYADVYSKDYPAGNVVLPGPDLVGKNVTHNYFILVKKQGAVLNTKPIITSSAMPEGTLGDIYKEKITAIDGIGKVKYSIASGKLPEGLMMNDDGVIYGGASKAGIYTFVVNATDSKSNSETKSLTIVIAESTLTVDNYDLVNTLNSINIYPNPSKQITNLLVNSSVSEKCSINFTDFLGKTIFSLSEYLKVGENIYKINTESLSNGVYNVEVVSSQLKKSAKLIINK
ncbi:MAG: T9SS C-terminal target domain-containing protein [Cytophagales bacterium]|nr:MAG: T9SS C-terminal target domain-containing protein [Cytophagales bacterium]